MRNQIFIPTNAESKEDIINSLDIQQTLLDADYIPGLMIYIRNGLKGVALDSIVQKQYENLSEINEIYGNAAIVVILSNIPIEEIDFLHNPQYATEHAMKGIDFAKNLPIGKRKIVTFHLNSLVPKKEYFAKSFEKWKKEFDLKIVSYLREIGKYSKSNGVEAKIETVPVPEFGDIPQEDPRTYLGVKLHELRNPFYIIGDMFQYAYPPGIGVCLDLCHSRTIYEHAKQENANELFHADIIGYLKTRSLFNDVLALKQFDIVHLNDGKGLYDEKTKTSFEEGIALGKGDIKGLSQLIKHLDSKKIAYVLEINETDFANRPETRDSIEYLVNLYK